jgi:arylsulfatase A-like enzyme
MREMAAGSHERAGTAPLAAHAVMSALWITAAFALIEYANADRYPGYHLLWTGGLLALGFVSVAVLSAAIERVAPPVPPGSLAAGLCVAFAAAPAVDLHIGDPAVSILGGARLLLLGASVAIAIWSLRRTRVSRLGLGTALAAMCLVWVLCGALRSPDIPRLVRRLVPLGPPIAACVLLLPGLPRVGPLLSRARLLGTLAAGAVLVLLPLFPRTVVPVRLAAPSAKAPATPRSAVLIVLDTLRRDHMSLYGYSRETTPQLERRARGGLVFDDASSVSAWTLPSHASMFTGRWPRTHGAHAFSREQAPRHDRSLHVNPLARESVTLAEIAREHGYRTAGLTANHFYLSSHWGMDQGFEEYLCRRPRWSGMAFRTAKELARRLDTRRSVTHDKPYFRAPEITRAAIEWLERHQDTPFFLFLNYMDVHAPNAAPGSQGLPFEDESFRPDVEKRDPILRIPLRPSVLRSLVNEYDREVHFLDHWVGVLLDHLERSGLAARTLVVITADHGEFLGERGFVGHGKDLHTETVDVPLIVWEPGKAPGRVSRPVQGPDVFPTILRYLGLPVPEGTQGQPLLEADHATVSEEHYAPGGRLPRFERVLRTIRMGTYRYFLSTSGEERLFDLHADPREIRNLVSEQPAVARAARARLEEWTLATEEAQRAARPQQLDAEALEDMRALGYIN